MRTHCIFPFLILLAQQHSGSTATPRTVDVSWPQSRFFHIRSYMETTHPSLAIYLSASHTNIANPISAFTHAFILLLTLFPFILFPHLFSLHIALSCLSLSVHITPIIPILASALASASASYNHRSPTILSNILFPLQSPLYLLAVNSCL
jgi:hypothetical protein